MVVFAMVNKYEYKTMINNIAVLCICIFNKIGQENRSKLSFYNIVRFIYGKTRRMDSVRQDGT